MDRVVGIGGDTTLGRSFAGITTAPLSTSSEEDTYPTHDSWYGLGGSRELETIEARDNLPNYVKRVGMRVFVEETNKSYEWTRRGWVEDPMDLTCLAPTPLGSSVWELGEGGWKMVNRGVTVGDKLGISQQVPCN